MHIPNLIVSDRTKVRQILFAESGRDRCFQWSNARITRQRLLCTRSSIVLHGVQRSGRWRVRGLYQCVIASSSTDRQYITARVEHCAMRRVCPQKHAAASAAAAAAIKRFAHFLASHVARPSIRPFVPESLCRPSIHRSAARTATIIAGLVDAIAPAAAPAAAAASKL